MSFIGAYGGLFLISLGAATFLPIQSEFLLTGLLLKTDYSVVALVLVASLGNTLGSVINWVIGLQIEKFKDKKWFPATPEQLDRASRWYQRYVIRFQFLLVHLKSLKKAELGFANKWKAHHCSEHSPYAATKLWLLCAVPTCSTHTDS